MYTAVAATAGPASTRLLPQTQQRENREDRTPGILLTLKHVLWKASVLPIIAVTMKMVGIVSETKSVNR